MKYRDILQFEPITDVIQLDKLVSKDYREDIIKSFVYPEYFIETIIPEIVKNLKFGERNKKGIQIIGNYGTGKSATDYGNGHCLSGRVIGAQTRESARLPEGKARSLSARSQ